MDKIKLTKEGRQRMMEWAKHEITVIADDVKKIRMQDVPRLYENILMMGEKAAVYVYAMDEYLMANNKAAHAAFQQAKADYAEEGAE